ncbi:hypothetical protein F5Y18DRAFT_420757 [Xylariaceae sp. FL1019]|nr:hypothetical protein F5Y18DRAFT_420757 [Xylariaceae sp. FL1019]
MSSLLNGFHNGSELNGDSRGTSVSSRTSSDSDSQRQRGRLTRRKSSPMMPPFMVSAPGKVIVFGEHAVVHGKAAIAASISLRSYLHVTTLSKSRRTFTIRFPDIDMIHSWNIDDLPWELFSQPSKKKYYYDLVTSIDPELMEAIQPHLIDVSVHKSPAERKIHQNSAACFLYLFLSLGSQKFPGCVYTLRSTIPIGAGLGSSASIAVCLAAALLLQIRTLSGPHPDQPPEEARLQIERINRWAFVAEMAIHGNPSGVDNTVSTQGKAVVFQRTDYEKPPVVTPLWDFPELPLLLLDTRTPKSTLHEVAKVAKLKNTHPKLVGSILDAVDKVTRTAEGLIDEEDFDSEEDESLRRMGELISINHGLLASLGVSHPRLERIRELIDFQGLGWSKLTGAGGGGCSITLLKPSVPAEKLRALEDQLDSEGYAQFKTTLGGDGVGVLWPAVLKNGMDDDEEGGMEIDLDSFLKASGTEGVETLVGVHGGTGEREGWNLQHSITPALYQEGVALLRYRNSQCPRAARLGRHHSKAQAPTREPHRQPQTIREVQYQRWAEADPIGKIVHEEGSDALSPNDRKTYHALLSARTPGFLDRLSKKSHREVWKQLNDANVTLLRVPPPTDKPWGLDANGRDLGNYTTQEFAQYSNEKARLALLRIESDSFRRRRHSARTKLRNPETGKRYTITPQDIEAEKTRREEMASIRQKHTGARTFSYVNDPAWDDVVPVPQEEPEGALAAIAYPDDYAEAMAYLRAVMANKEKSQRCLSLTEDIIELNPAHYTVWLYRFDIIKACGMSINDELDWLNRVSLENLKNYQIWHHRQLLIEEFSEVESHGAKRSELVKSERNFITRILEKDTKNYHVWSYRQFLVSKLGLWDLEEEMTSVNDMIKQDVRNNSAWSHRFFLVFSNPETSTADSHATEHDPKVPGDIIDREVDYAKRMIQLAPQNQSPWNYLRGVLAKGGRPLESVVDFVRSFFSQLGEADEEVRSSHAVDYLAEICAGAGDSEGATLALNRLAQKWDPIRKGYWQYRKRLLEEPRS